MNEMIPIKTLMGDLSQDTENGCLANFYGRIALFEINFYNIFRKAEKNDAVDPVEVMVDFLQERINALPRLLFLSSAMLSISAMLDDYDCNVLEEEIEKMPKIVEIFGESQYSLEEAQAFEEIFGDLKALLSRELATINDALLHVLEYERILKDGEYYVEEIERILDYFRSEYIKSVQTLFNDIKEEAGETISAARECISKMVVRRLCTIEAKMVSTYGDEGKRAFSKYIEHAVADANKPEGPDEFGLAYDDYEKLFLEYEREVQ